MRSLLSPRQQQTLDYVSFGKSNEDIALIMGLSKLTVKNNVQAVLRKLDACNRTCLIRKAIELGLLVIQVKGAPKPAEVPNNIVFLAKDSGNDALEKEGLVVTLDGIAKVGDKQFYLGHIGLRLLTHFFSNVGHTFSRDTLLNEGWGGDKALEDRTVDVRMRRIRIILEGSPWAVETVRGVGYKLVRRKLN